MAKRLKEFVHVPEIKVLIYKEDDQYLAHALELDIIGAADTIDGAKRELIELIIAQLDFALANDIFESVYKPAPDSFFTRWEKQHTKEMVSVFGSFEKKPQPRKTFAETLPINALPSRVLDRIPNGCMVAG